MATTIYYFSGSGNSLIVARDLAFSLNGSLIPIAPLMDKKQINLNSEIIGIVFPVYFADFNGVPFIVQRFIDKLTPLGSKYLFAVCTHAAGPGSTIERLKKMIQKKGGNLAAGFNIQMSVPYSVFSKIKHAITKKKFDHITIIEQDKEKQQQLFKRWEKKLDFISSYVSQRKEGTYETSNLLIKILRAPFLPLNKLMFRLRYRNLAQASKGSLERLVHMSDNSFQVNDNCIACETCVKVCPVDNIELVDNKPVWLHHCENCLACYHWCPEAAIEGEIVRFNKKEHHPEVSLKDFLAQKYI
ncbi:hypothetical protein EU523_00390 [Candidatus Heimdallarchaeota archaeon]|nr:MAG: hypothetical protein EU523_00390 [Candidatus Heimdallarchaeota archaeon]